MPQKKGFSLPTDKIFRAWSDCIVEFCSSQDTGKGQCIALLKTMKFFFLPHFNLDFILDLASTVPRKLPTEL